MYEQSSIRWFSHVAIPEGLQQLVEADLGNQALWDFVINSTSATLHCKHDHVYVWLSCFVFARTLVSQRLVLPVCALRLHAFALCGDPRMFDHHCPLRNDL